MARPQLEDGLTPIANELVEALCRINLSAYESRVLWFIIRKTYGYRKKVDRISFSQFTEGTGIDRRHIGRVLNSLKRKNIILCSGTGYLLEYGIQKDYEIWKFDTNLGNDFDTHSGNDLTPVEATIADDNLTPIQGGLTPIQGGLTPKEATILTPVEVLQKKERNIQKKTTKEIIVDLPDFLNKESWDGFLEMRRSIKKPLTEAGAKIALKKLEQFKNDGEDPNEILNKSTMHSWQGLFSLKTGGTNGTNRQFNNAHVGISPGESQTDRLKASLNRGKDV